MSRIEQEVFMVPDRYGPRMWHTNERCLVFENYTLPQGWSRSCVPLLVALQPGYPEVAPDNFYVEPSLTLKGGVIPSNFTLGPRFLEREWGQFSIHSGGDWRPCARPEEGDNLATFLLIVDARFAEVN